MEEDNILPTFQQWRQEANANKMHFKERFDLHRRMLHAATDGDVFAVQACIPLMFSENSLKILTHALTCMMRMPRVLKKPEVRRKEHL